MKTFLHYLLLCLAFEVAAVLGGPVAAAATLQVTAPSLDLSVGQTGGFGFSFTNDSRGFAVFNNSDLDQQSGGYGIYTDFIGTQPDLVIVAPEATISQIFDNAAQTGAGSYTFWPAAKPGTTINGTLTIFYDTYSVSPNNPAFDSIADYLSSQSVSTNVNLVAVAAPEPTGWTLAAVGLILIVLSRKYV